MGGVGVTNFMLMAVRWRKDRHTINVAVHVHSDPADS